MIWTALTDVQEMKQWYFDLPEFRAEKGCHFSFYGGTEEKQFLHLCEVTEVVPGEKLSYTWRYDGYPGNTLVSFQLQEEATHTRVVLTHTGLESFPADVPEFAAANFEAGWNHIIGQSLRHYLEQKASI